MDSHDGRADLERLFLQQRPLIQRLVAFTAWRYQLTPQDTEDFESWVTLKIIDDDYRVLRQFAGRSTLKSYLTVVVNREIIEFHRRAYGKRRHPPGEVAKLIDQYGNRENYPVERIRDLLQEKHGVEVTQEDVERAIADGRRLHCGRSFVGEEAFADRPSPNPDPEQSLVAEERRRQLERVHACIDRLITQLPELEGTMLTLRFKKGMKIVDIARQWRVEEKPLFRRFQIVLRKLREALCKEGIDGPFVRDLLSND